MKKILIWSAVIMVALATIVPTYWPLKSYFDDYAIKASEEKFGGKHLEKKHEDLVKNIALELGISEPIEIRRMNSVALRTFGYYNAFVYIYQIFNLIPTDKPVIFFSEGFFEDLSPEEQRFIIGHELIHLKERHFKYENIIHLVLNILILAIFLYVLKPNGKILLDKNIVTSEKSVQIALSIICIWILFMTKGMGLMAYRRYIEKIADCSSLEILNTHEGGLKLLARWEKEFKMANGGVLNNIFGCHPTLEERKVYCLKREI